MGETRLKRYRRYFKYVLEWIFAEKMRGLDFTMRDTSLVTDRVGGGKLHGYSKTDEAHAVQILDSLHVTERLALLDVGCGKGAFLRVAARYPFGAIAGIEISGRLVRIAGQNFRKLGLAPGRIQVWQADAVKFGGYSKFNTFYFFNPFDEKIMEEVAGKIEKSQHGEYYMVMHNPVSAAVAERHGGTKVLELYDPVKSYQTYIYKCRAEARAEGER